MNNLPDIIIPHHNRWDLIGNCLKNIPMEYKVFIVRGFTFAKACNKGASLSKADKLLFLNDDVILTKQVLNELQQHDEDIVGIPLRIPSLGKIVYGMSMYWGKYGNVNTLIESIKTQLDFNNADECQIPATGAAFMVKRKIFEKLGNLNAEYRNGGEDNELFLKAVERGYSFGHINSVCDHFHSSSSGRYDNDVFNHKLLAKNFPKERLLKIMGKSTLDNTLISVIIPTRAVSGEPACLESLKSQTHKDIEIIIIRDKDKKGASWARNQGRKQAKGNFLFFLDDDVELKPIMLEVLLSKLQYSNSSLAYCNYNRQGELTGKVKGVPWNIDILKNRNYISTMSLLRTEDFPKEGFDETLERFQDWDLWLRIAEQGKHGIHIDETLFTAYYDKGNISCNKDNIEKATQIIKNKHINNYLDNNKIMKTLSNIPFSNEKGETKEIKLELGGKSPVYLDGKWKHLDTQMFPHIDYKVNSFFELPFEENTVSEIFGKRIFQKFSKNAAIKVLKEWHRILKSQGKITLVCVDIKNSMGKFLQSYQENFLELIFGNQEDTTEYYLYGYTKESLIKLMKEVGFDEVKAVMPQASYYDPSIEVIIEGIKK